MRAPAQRLASLAFACLLHVLCLWVLISPFKHEHATTTIAASPSKQAVRSAPEPPQRDDDADAHVPKPSSLRVYGYDFDLRKVRTRWRDLFPFVTTSLLLQSAASATRAQGGLVFADPAIVPRPLPPSPPMLVMSDTAIQQLTDRTWSRRDRWTHFADYVKLATAYHPDRGRLSSALRAYIQQNALQPYADVLGYRHETMREPADQQLVDPALQRFVLLRIEPAMLFEQQPRPGIEQARQSGVEPGGALMSVHDAGIAAAQQPRQPQR